MKNTGQQNLIHRNKIATTSYCANASENIMSVLGNNDETTQIEK